MKKKLLLPFYVLSLLFLVSCSNEDLDLGKNESQNSEKNGSIEFIYEGKLYSSTYFSTQDSLIILDDKIANEVYRNLGLNPTLAVVINEDGVLTYYDSYDKIPLLSSERNNISTRSSLENSMYDWISFTVDMFEDSSYNGKRISFMIDKSKTKIYIPSLRAYGMNDKISSLKYRFKRIYSPSRYPAPFATQFTLFQDDNYQGKSITFFTVGIFNAHDTEGEMAIRRLKEVPMGRGKNWNDRASSVIIGQ